MNNSVFAMLSRAAQQVAADRRRPGIADLHSLPRLAQQRRTGPVQNRFQVVQHLDVVHRHELVGQVQQHRPDLGLGQFLPEHFILPGPDVEQRQTLGLFGKRLWTGVLESGIQLASGLRVGGRFVRFALLLIDQRAVVVRRREPLVAAHRVGREGLLLCGGILLGPITGQQLIQPDRFVERRLGLAQGLDGALGSERRFCAAARLLPLLRLGRMLLRASQGGDAMQVLELPGQIVGHREFVALQRSALAADEHRNFALGPVAGEGIGQQLLAANAGHLRRQERQVAVAGHVIPLRRHGVQQGHDDHPADDHRQPVPSHKFA